MSLSAGVINISRGSFHDGNGVRTVVYLKGCNMRCQWCHNPESISVAPQILYAKSKCICCGICINTCPEHHIIKDSQHLFIKDGCSYCGKCAENCPVNALELCGADKSTLEVFNEIIKDKHYYDTSNGGVTFSGGECLLHFNFMLEIVKLCKEALISVIIESAMNIPWRNVEQLLPFIDSFYVDIKHMDCEIHKKYTGCENIRILQNIKLLSKFHNNIIVRVPLIPNVNDSFENLYKTAEFAKGCGDAIKGMELLKYNTLGESKYSLLQEQYVSFSYDTQNNKYMDDICSMLNFALNDDKFVFYVR